MDEPEKIPSNEKKLLFVKVRTEIQTDDEGKSTYKEIREIPFLTIIPFLSILVTSIVSITSIYLVYQNNEKQREFEFKKITFSEELKCFTELLEASGKIVDYAEPYKSNENIPEDLIANFNKIYKTKLKIFVADNDSIAISAQEFKNVAKNWKGEENTINQANEVLNDIINKEINKYKK